MNIQSISAIKINNSQNYKFQHTKPINFSGQDTFIRVIDTKSKTQSVTQKIKLDGKDYNLKINPDTVEKYLCSNGRLDISKLRKFVETYKLYFDILSQEEENRKNSLKHALNSNTNIISINPKQETAQAMIKSMDKKDLSGSIIENIKDNNTRKEIAKRLLQIEEDFSSKKYDDAYRYVEQFFELSKTTDGYDFSDPKEKLEVLQEVNLTIYLNGQNDNTLKRIINCCKVDDKADLNKIKKLTELVRNSADAYSHVEYMNNLINKFISYDKDNENEIFNAMLRVSKGYPISEKDGCFENAFEYCFNPLTKEYDSKRVDVLIEFLNEVGENIDLNAEDFDKEFERYNQFEKETLDKYFNSITNPFTGKLTEEITPPKEFIENITQ